MRDEHDGRLWAELHLVFSTQMFQLIDKLCNVFRVLHAHQFQTPWDEVARQPARCNCRNTP